MDREQVAGLTAEMKAQFRLMEQVSDKLDSRISDGLDTPAQLESIAYQIHNLYCSVEDLLKLVASTFENHIGSKGNWHEILLLRMSQPIEGIRPAFLSEETFGLMRKLKNFRHMFRHAYGADIELDQLRGNIVAAQKLYDLIDRDMNTFLSQLTGDDEA
ncbi:MAG: hypothetical protein AAFY33_14400 [Cyanobacteria bacterium J06643_4]